MSGALFRRQVYYLAAGMMEGLRPRHVESAQAWLEASREQQQELLASRLATMTKYGLRADRTGSWLPQDKPAVRAQLPQTLARGEVWRKTSGSSGIPFRFPRSPEMLRHMDAVMWAAYSWHGVAPGDRHAVLWGRPLRGNARLRKRLSDVAMSRRRYDAFSVSVDESVRFFRELLRYGPTWLYGYPSLTAAFVQHCLSHGLSGRELGLRVVILTGELLPEVTRELVASFFGCRVINEYGSTEGGVLGFECGSGAMHTTPGATLLESLDEHHRPTTGAAGRFAITDLLPSSVSFDRLLLGDQGTLQSADGCACGRSLPTVSALLGRNDSWIRLPSGRLVYDAVLAYAMPNGVAVFQGQQTSSTELAVRLVLRPGATADTEAVATELRQRLDGELAVSVQVVDDIPAGPSGKLRYFVPLEEMTSSSAASAVS